MTLKLQYQLILDFNSGMQFPLQHSKWARIPIKMSTESHGHVHLESVGHLWPMNEDVPGNHNGIQILVDPHKLPRAAWSISIAVKSALKFPAPNPVWL